MTPMTQAVGWALVHFLWQGTLVALGLAAALSLLRSRSATSATIRYTVSAGALALLPALLVATALRSYSDNVPAAPVARSEAAASGSPTSFALYTAPASAPAVRELLQPYVPSLFSIWLGGVALLSVWHLGGWTQARRLTRIGPRPVDGRWEMALLRLRSRLGIDRAVEILESSSVPVPAVVGIITVGRLGASRECSFASSGRISPPFGTTAATAFAVSRALPPPIPRIASAPCRRANSTAACA